MTRKASALSTLERDAHQALMDDTDARRELIRREAMIIERRRRAQIKRTAGILDDYESRGEMFVEDDDLDDEGGDGGEVEPEPVTPIPAPPSLTTEVRRRPVVDVAVPNLPDTPPTPLQEAHRAEASRYRAAVADDRQAIVDAATARFSMPGIHEDWWVRQTRNESRYRAAKPKVLGSV